MKILAVLFTASITACASIPQDGGVGVVENIFRQHGDSAYTLPRIGAPLPMSPEDVTELLKQPLPLRLAERVAVEANPIVKAQLANVGIAEADFAQASRIENPGLSYERLSGGDTDVSLLFDIGGLLLIPLRRQMEQRRLQSARYNAAREVMEHIAETRKAWINAVAEKQRTALMMRALESVETSNNLTRQMTALGHSNTMEAAESELLLGEMRASLIRQHLAEGTAKEALIRQLGLWGQAARDLTLPDFLPSPPKQPLDIPAIEQQVVESRLDVQMAKANLEGMAKNFKLTRLNPFITTIESGELGPVREIEGGERESGYEIELRLPIFDAGGIKAEKARFIYEQSKAQAEVTVVAAASYAREAIAAYQSTWDITVHMETQLLPLRQRISAEQLLQYNGMLISVFDLLKDLLNSISMESNYVNTLRDFWLADAGLQDALSGVGSPELRFSGSAMMPDSDGEEGH